MIYYFIKFLSQAIFRNRRSRTVAKIGQYVGNIFLSNNFQSRSNRTVATIAGSIMYLCDPCDCAIAATLKIVRQNKISYVEIFFLYQYLGIAGVAQSQGSQRYIIGQYEGNIFLSNNFQSRRSRTVARIEGSI